MHPPATVQASSTTGTGESNGLLSPWVRYQLLPTCGGVECYPLPAFPVGQNGQNYPTFPVGQVPLLGRSFCRLHQGQLAQLGALGRFRLEVAGVGSTGGRHRNGRQLEHGQRRTHVAAV